MTRHARWLSPRATGIVAAVLAPFLVAGCSAATLARQNADLSRRVASDSVAMLHLQQQIAALRSQCHADSIRMATDRAMQRAVPDSVAHARDAEIASLRDQLTKANAELDRIKRRLANPRP